jgi:hypothetical protein
VVVHSGMCISPYKLRKLVIPSVVVSMRLFRDVLLTDQENHVEDVGSEARQKCNLTSNGLDM